MNPQTVGSDSAGLWDGFASAAGAVAGLVNAFKGDKPAQLPSTPARPAVTAPGGVPVWGWIVGGVALLFGLVLVLRKP
jgi:hypothetical protein